jgi:hypothetical protein
MTADHYALVSESCSGSFAARAAVPAAAVRPGHFVWTPHAFKTVAEAELVTKVDTVSGTGIIALLTLEGTGTWLMLCPCPACIASCLLCLRNPQQFVQSALCSEAPPRWTNLP